MGILARRFEELRFDAARWLNDDDYEGAPTPSGVRVNWRTAVTHPVVWRCIDLLASAVAGAPKDVVVRVGKRSFPDVGKPAWLVEPRPGDPTYTIDDYFMQVAISLLSDGNYFTHVYPHVYDPQILTIHPPQNIAVRPGPLYDLRDMTGKVIRTFGPAEILHGTWIRPAGELRGIAPLEALRRGLSTSIAAEDFAGRFFGQGATLSFGVEVPGSLEKAQKEELQTSLKGSHAGLRKSHSIGVLTGGAKFVPNLSATPEQMQLTATQKALHEYLCTPFGVPPGMAGGSFTGESYAASEVDDKQFAERAVLPLAQRIERQHNRIVSVPEGITDPDATAQFRFNLNNVARVNILTRAQAYRELVTSGVMKPAEARDKEDLEPVDGADQLFMQAQMTPITKLGQKPAPVAVPPEAA